MQFAVGIRLSLSYTICYTGPYQLYFKCKIFWKIPSKRNWVLQSDSEKKRQTDKQRTDSRQSRPCATLNA
jgi:hypothetical protein